MKERELTSETADHLMVEAVRRNVLPSHSFFRYHELTNRAQRTRATRNDMGEIMSGLTIPDLYRAQEIVAYLDVLGWRSLTRCPPEVFRELRNHARAHERPGETGPVSPALEDYRKSMERAIAIDIKLRDILRDLRTLTRPLPTQRDPYWRRAHVTFVHLSDGIFLHSTAYAAVFACVAEIMKRSLQSGVLVRGGLAIGFVRHRMEPLDGDRDSRSFSHSLVGTGVSSAVAAEKGPKRDDDFVTSPGARVFVDDGLAELIRNEEQGESVGLLSEYGSVLTELAWWGVPEEHRAHHNEEGRPTRWTRGDVRALIEALRVSPEFAWNRDSMDGQRKLEDTIQVLRRAERDLPEA